MGRTFTVAQLVSMAKKRADVEGDDFVGDEEVKGILSTGYAELYSILVDAGARYFEDKQTISADGSGSHALPSDHLSTVGVDHVKSDSRRALFELMAQERNTYETATGDAQAYALVGSNLELYPAPSSGTYEHIYVPQPTKLNGAADADKVDVVTPDGEAFLIWYVAVVAKEKEEASTAGVVQERERARERVQHWATMRAMHAPRRRVVRRAPTYLDDPDAFYDPADWRWGF